MDKFNMLRILTDKYIDIPKGTVIEVLGVTPREKWACKICGDDDRIFYAYIEDIIPVSKELLGGL